MAAARELGFLPSLIPQIMLTNRSGIVAVVVGGLENAFYGRVLEAFALRLRDLGKQVLIVPVESDYALDAVAARLSQYRVDAIVSALAVLSQQVADTLSAFQIPIVSFNTPVTATWVSAVGSDNRAGGRQAAMHLYGQGGRRFGFLAGPAESPASLERLQGFREGLQTLGAQPPRIIAGDYTYSGGRAAIEGLPRESEVLDALFCANDLAALGAMDALRGRHGRRIPDDVMMVGYDDNPAAAWSPYDLSTFDQNVPALVEATIELIALPVEERTSGKVVLVPPVLKARGSSRRL
jgi:DNA-binding LacI/PurR family transcriptional regulator